MSDRFSLKDHLFNAQTVAQLAAEFAAALPDFDAAAFKTQALSGFPERELMQRLEWLADCVEAVWTYETPPYGHLPQHRVLPHVGLSVCAEHAVHDRAVTGVRVRLLGPVRACDIRSSDRTAVRCGTLWLQSIERRSTGRRQH